MDQHNRARILRSELATKLRGFLGDALNDHDQLPGKAALKTRIEEEFGDVAGLDKAKLEEAFIKYAKLGQDKSKRFDARAAITEATLTVVTKLEKADKLIDAPEEDEYDAGALADKARDPYGHSAAVDAWFSE